MSVRLHGRRVRQEQRQQGYCEPVSVVRHVDIGLVDIDYTCLRVEEIAKKKGVSMAQIALAWAMNKEGTFHYTEIILFTLASSAHYCFTRAGVTAPIVGSTSLKNLQDLIGNQSTPIYL